MFKLGLETLLTLLSFLAGLVAILSKTRESQKLSQDSTIPPHNPDEKEKARHKRLTAIGWVSLFILIASFVGTLVKHAIGASADKKIAKAHEKENQELAHDRGTGL